MGGKVIPLELPPGAPRVGLRGEKIAPGINRAAAAAEGGSADWAARPLKCGGRCPLAARGHIRPRRAGCRGGGPTVGSCAGFW